MAGGYAVSKADAVNAVKGWRVGLAAVTFTGLLGLGQASALYGFWPNSTRLIAAVERDLPARGPMLMQAGDQMLASFYLFHHVLPPEHITSFPSPPHLVATFV